MICARDKSTLATTTEELARSGEVHSTQADMADPGDVIGLIEATVETLGGIDIVVSNVSAFGGADFESSFEVDIRAAQALLRGSLDHMADHDEANIVCIGSRAGGIGIPWMPAYAAVKAATVSMVKSLALEVARRGIRANVVSPGDITFPGGTWERIETDNPKLHQAVLRDNPMRRFGRQEVVGDVVGFVASPLASFINGANIYVDGAASKHLQL
jgi:NAD(P)-dependent dehydrogenase (short-subunit alcohol dehydrogenase family)